MSNKQDEHNAVAQILNNGASAATLGVAYMKRIDENRKSFVDVPLPRLSSYMAPLLPGTVTTFTAMSHHGKSLSMREMAFSTAERLAAMGKDDVVVWIDTETPVDMLALNDMVNHAGMTMPDVMRDTEKYQRGKSKVIDQSVSMAKKNIMFIAPRLGSSVELTLSNIHRALTMLRTGQYDGKEHKIGAIFVDYLQTLPYDKEVKSAPGDNQRRIQVNRDIERIRDMTYEFECPAIVAVQAKQIDQINYKIGSMVSKSEFVEGKRGFMTLPGPYDGQETSSIFYRADYNISQVIPVRLPDFNVGDKWIFERREFDITKTMVVLQVHKQRIDGFPAGAVFIYDVNFNRPAGQRFSYVWCNDEGVRNGR